MEVGEEPLPGCGEWQLGQLRRDGERRERLHVRREASPASEEGAPQLPAPQRAQEQGLSPSPAVAPSRGHQAERTSPPPPGLRADARPSSAPEAAPVRSSRDPDAGLGAAPPSKITKGRQGRAQGHSSGKAPHRGSVPRERSSKYDRSPGIPNSPRKVSTCPGVGRAHRSARSLSGGPPAAGTCLFPRLQQRGPGGAARPIGHERGFLQLSRPRCLTPGAPPGAACTLPSGPAPCRRSAGLGTELAGLRRKKAGARTVLPGAPHHAPAWRLALRPRSEPRGPRRTLAAAGAAGSPQRECPSVHIRRPPAAAVPASTQRTRTDAAPRREHQPPAGAARAGVPNTLISGRPPPAPLVLSPGPGWARQLRRSAARGRRRARRLRQRAACPSAGEPSSGAAAADLGWLRDARRVRFGQSSPRPALRNAPPLPADPAAPRSCRPQAAPRSAGAGWMQRCARRGRPARAREARESPAGRVRAPPAPGAAPRCLGCRAARTRGATYPERAGEREQHEEHAGAHGHLPRRAAPRRPPDAWRPEPVPRRRRPDSAAPIAAAAAQAGPAPAARLRRRDCRPAPGARPSPAGGGLPRAGASAGLSAARASVPRVRNCR